MHALFKQEKLAHFKGNIMGGGGENMVVIVICTCSSSE